MNIDITKNYNPLRHQKIVFFQISYVTEYSIHKDDIEIWSAKIDSFDAYVFVTPEYNHGIPGALKNAIDFLFKEWNNKVTGFVSYGSAGGVYVQSNICVWLWEEVKVATVRLTCNYLYIRILKTFQYLNPIIFMRNRLTLC